MKKQSKKLMLNKETIAALDSDQMNNVKGGFTYFLSLGKRCKKSNNMTGGGTECYTRNY